VSAEVGLSLVCIRTRGGSWLRLDHRKKFSGRGQLWSGKERCKATVMLDITDIADGSNIYASIVSIPFYSPNLSCYCRSYLASFVQEPLYSRGMVHTSFNPFTVFHFLLAAIFVLFRSCYSIPCICRFFISYQYGHLVFFLDEFLVWNRKLD
jgi:hypothetical protein